MSLSSDQNIQNKANPLIRHCKPKGSEAACTARIWSVNKYEGFEQSATYYLTTVSLQQFTLEEHIYPFRTIFQTLQLSLGWMIIDCGTIMLMILASGSQWGISRHALEKTCPYQSSLKLLRGPIKRMRVAPESKKGAVQSIWVMQDLIDSHHVIFNEFPIAMLHSTEEQSSVIFAKFRRGPRLSASSRVGKMSWWCPILWRCRDGVLHNEDAVMASHLMRMQWWCPI